MNPEQNQPRQAKVTRLDELRRRKQRRIRRRIVILVIALAAAIVYFTDAYSSALAATADIADSVEIFLDRSGSFPLHTGIAAPVQIKPLAGGFVELGQEDVLISSGTGTLIRSIQHGYARPALTCGSRRFCLYNRAGTELRVESRTRTLYTKKFDNNILLCSMSPNGSVAVVTGSNRYTAELSVYDPSFGAPYVWDTTKNEGTPVQVAFAGDNQRLAVGCISAVGGQLSSSIYLLDTHKDSVVANYKAESGAALLDLQWISASQVLCVYDSFACILSGTSGAELCRFDYGGATVKSVSVYGRSAALLLSTRSGSRLILLNDKMNPIFDCDIASANQVTCTHNSVYVLRESTVERYDLTGQSIWVQSFDSQPRAVLNTDKLLVFVDSSACLLDPPADYSSRF